MRLEGEIDIANSKLDALERPRDVIMKHRELTQEALRDEETLVGLQNQLNQVRLEQARSPDPWELISLPRLLNRPVSPIKERILGIGLILGALTGASIALWKRKDDNYIYSMLELSEHLNSLVIEIHDSKKQGNSDYLKQLNVATLMCESKECRHLYTRKHRSISAR